MELTLNPEIGEHNDSVYGEWMGLDEAEIASLREDGAI
jgi:crotonobetainyl-CoA:carnitine CoA-transferase CaiB-like acyl-CoA transferase